jgi:hypothetical protein
MVPLMLDPHFDIEGNYRLKPNFLEVLRSVEGDHQLKTVFSYREVANLLSKYIMKHKDRLIDLRNVKILHLDGDLLGRAFNLRAVHRSQITKMIRTQLLPENEDQQVNGLAESEDMDSDTSINSSNDNNRYNAFLEYELPSTSDVSTRISASSNEDSDLQDVCFDSIANNWSCKSPTSEVPNTENSDSANSVWTDSMPYIGLKCPDCDISTSLPFCQECWKKRRYLIPARQNPRKRQRQEKQADKQAHAGQSTPGKSECRDTKAVKIQDKPAPGSEQPNQGKAGQDASSKTISLGIASLEDNCMASEGHPAKAATQEAAATSRLASASAVSICGLCCHRPKDTALVHGRLAHMYSCYPCAKRIFKQNRTCPVCRRKIEKVTKIIDA